MIDSEIVYTERGGYYFYNDDGAAVLYSEIETDVYLVASHIPGNYPAWSVYTVHKTKDELIADFYKFYDGWYVVKSQTMLNMDKLNRIVNDEECLDMYE